MTIDRAGAPRDSGIGPRWALAGMSPRNHYLRHSAVVARETAVHSRYCDTASARTSGLLRGARPAAGDPYFAGRREIDRRRGQVEAPHPPAAASDDALEVAGPERYVRAGETAGLAPAAHDARPVAEHDTGDLSA